MPMNHEPDREEHFAMTDCRFSSFCLFRLQPPAVGLRSCLLALCFLAAAAVAGSREAQAEAPAPDKASPETPGHHASEESQLAAEREESGRAGRSGRFFSRPLTGEDHVAALQVLKILDPEQAEKIATALRDNPAEVDQLIRERFPQLGRMLVMRRHDPQLFDLGLEDLRLGREVIATTRALRDVQSRPDAAEAELTQHKSALRTAVTDHFEIRRRIRAHELERLERRIQDLKQAIANEATRREQLIEERLEALVTGQSDAKAGLPVRTRSAEHAGN